MNGKLIFATVILFVVTLKALLFAQKTVMTIFMQRKEIGVRLKQAREDAGLSRDKVVANPETEVSRTTLQQWEGGITEASIEKILALANIYEVDPTWVIFGDRSSGSSKPESASSIDERYIQIPAYDAEVSAGHGMFSEGSIKPDKYMAFRTRWARSRGLESKKLAVLFTKGDSMSPTIPDGSAVVINTERNKALDGKVYVIRIDDRLYVKRTQWLIGGGLRLISDNPQYDPLDIKESDMQASDIEVCGQVIHASYDLPD